MSLELIRKFLKENGKGNPELSETHIEAAINEAKEQARTEAQEAEKARYISEAKKIRVDIDKLKPFKAALEEAGYDGTVELPEFIASLKAAKEEAKSKPAKTELEKQLAALTAQVKGLNDAKAEADREKDQLRQERKAAILKERLMKDVGEKLVNGEDTVKLLIHEGAVDLDEDGKTIVFKSGDTITPYDKGMKDFLKAREGSLKDNQRGGAGSTPGNGRPQASANMSPEEMLRLPRK
jgi:hypothetical protein